MKKLILIFTLILLTLFTGCIGMDINQKIYRDQTTDVSIRFSADSQAILNMGKNELTKNISSDWVYSEDEKSFTFSKKRVDLKTLKSSSFGAARSPFSTAEFKEELKFPYYYYTYTFIEPAEPSKRKSTSINEYGEEFKNAVSLNYNLEVFGDIVETNGLKTGDNSVRFKLELEPDKDKKHYVVFKDFFLRTWLNI